MRGTLSNGQAPVRALRSPQAFIAGLGAAQIVSWGSLIYSFPLLAEPMAAELGWSKAEVYLLASLALGCSGLTAIPVGSAIDRGHGRAVMTAGSLLAGVLLWAWSALPGGCPLVLVFIGLGLAQSMTLYEPGFAFAPLYGGANGIMTIVRGAAVPDMLTRSAYGVVNGMLTVPTALLKAVAPTLAAMLWQWNGSYGPVMTATITASLVVVGRFGFAASRLPR